MQSACVMSHSLPLYNMVIAAQVDREWVGTHRTRLLHAMQNLLKLISSFSMYFKNQAQGSAMHDHDDERLSSDGAFSWGGEEYEEESARGVRPSYLKFSKRLLRRPEQCVRWVRLFVLMLFVPFCSAPTFLTSLASAVHRKVSLKYPAFLSGIVRAAFVREAFVRKASLKYPAFSLQLVRAAFVRSGIYEGSTESKHGWKDGS